MSEPTLPPIACVLPPTSITYPAWGRCLCCCWQAFLPLLQVCFKDAKCQVVYISQKFWCNVLPINCPLTRLPVGAGPLRLLSLATLLLLWGDQEKLPQGRTVHGRPQVIVVSIDRRQEHSIACQSMVHASNQNINPINSKKIPKIIFQINH